ncbi:MAG: hypothetical protein RR202_10455 [Bacteroidales bacterium]
MTLKKVQKNHPDATSIKLTMKSYSFASKENWERRVVDYYYGKDTVILFAEVKGLNVHLITSKEAKNKGLIDAKPIYL